VRRLVSSDQHGKGAKEDGNRGVLGIYGGELGRGAELRGSAD
jgi:hypothetical protein